MNREFKYSINLSNLILFKLFFRYFRVENATDTAIVILLTDLTFTNSKDFYEIFICEITHYFPQCQIIIF